MGDFMLYRMAICTGVCSSAVEPEANWSPIIGLKSVSMVGQLGVTLRGGAERLMLCFTLESPIKSHNSRSHKPVGIWRVRQTLYKINPA